MTPRHGHSNENSFPAFVWLKDRVFPSLESLQITKSVLCNFATIQVLPFLNNAKYLDPSYKMDLDSWDCFGRKKCLISEEIQQPESNFYIKVFY